MNNYKRFLIHLTILLLLLPAVSVAIVPFDSDHSNVSYTQSQIDSLVSVEVHRQLDTQLIGLKIDKAASDKFGKYIEEENNHLSFLSILVTAISFLMAVVALVVPFIINKQRERIINEKLKDYKDSIDQYVKESKEKVSQFVDKWLHNINTSISRQAEFSVLLIRALSNKNEDVRLNLLNETIDKYADESFVSSAYNARGNLYFEREKYDNAISDYKKAIKKDSEFADAYYNRGRVYSKKNNCHKAIEELTKAIILSPDCADYYMLRGATYYQIKDYDNAIEDTTNAIELRPDCVDYYIFRGNTYFLNGNRDRAIEDFTKAIEENPYHAEAYYLRANLYKVIGKKAKAKADYKKAKELGYKE